MFFWRFLCFLWWPLQLQSKLQLQFKLQLQCWLQLPWPKMKNGNQQQSKSHFLSSKTFNFFKFSIFNFQFSIFGVWHQICKLKILKVLRGHICEIHKPNNHDQSRQQQPPHKQTRKQELALWWLTILPGWVTKRVGPGQRPTVHPCPLRWGGCGLLTNSTTHNNESKKTQHGNNMVAELVLRDLSVPRTSVARSLGTQNKCVIRECADVPDVSNAVWSDDLSNVVFRAETLWQCMLGFSTNKMVGDNKVLTTRCR